MYPQLSSLTQSRLYQSIYCSANCLLSVVSTTPLVHSDNALLQINDKPTHTGGNILDLIRRLFQKSCYSFLWSSSSSDHFTLTLHLSTSQTSHSCYVPKYVYDYPKADYNRLCSYLLDFNFSPCLLLQDVQSVWYAIKNVICVGMTFFIPKVRSHHHQYPCCYTPKLRHLSKCLHSLRKKVSKNPTPYLCNKLEMKTSNLYDQIQSAKSLYKARLVKNFAGNSNSKIYDYIQSLSMQRWYYSLHCLPQLS